MRCVIKRRRHSEAEEEEEERTSSSLLMAEGAYRRDGPFGGKREKKLYIESKKEPRCDEKQSEMTTHRLRI